MGSATLGSMAAKIAFPIELNTLSTIVLGVTGGVGETKADEDEDEDEVTEIGVEIDEEANVCRLELKLGEELAEVINEDPGDELDIKLEDELTDELVCVLVEELAANSVERLE